MFLQYRTCCSCSVWFWWLTVAELNLRNPAGPDDAKSESGCVLADQRYRTETRGKIVSI